MLGLGLGFWERVRLLGCYWVWIVEMVRLLEMYIYIYRDTQTYSA